MGRGNSSLSYATVLTFLATVMAVVVLVAAIVTRTAEAIHCDDIYRNCGYYMFGIDRVPRPECCGLMRHANETVMTTTEGRRYVCNCFADVPPLCAVLDWKIRGIPGHCHIPFPFVASQHTDCSRVF